MASAIQAIQEMATAMTQQSATTATQAASPTNQQVAARAQREAIRDQTKEKRLLLQLEN
jgi:hypothetical protein